MHPSSAEPSKSPPFCLPSNIPDAAKLLFRKIHRRSFATYPSHVCLGSDGCLGSEHRPPWHHPMTKYLHRIVSHYRGGLPGGVVPGDGGRYSWAEFSLTAAKRLARGSRASLDSSSLRRDGSPSPSLSCRGRLGCLSPVDSRIICSVRHPGVDRSWKDSAKSLPTATWQRATSSS